MMNCDLVLEDFSYMKALWASNVDDDMDLARIADLALQNKVDSLSVLPEYVAKLWAWLEKKKVQIVARFYSENMKKNIEKNISLLTENINFYFKQGAGGAQVFIKKSDIGVFVNELRLIRDDLFFNKTLSIGLNISDILPLDTENIFFNLKKIKADSLLLVLPKDDGEKSDFVGKVYGILNGWDEGFYGGLHFVIGNSSLRIEQVIRLVQKIRPELLSKIRFFITC